MFRRLVKYKGSNTFERGRCLGWKATGAYESRATGDCRQQRTSMVLMSSLQRSSLELLSYSPQGILMRHAGQAQKYRRPTLEMEASEEETKEIANAGATGVVTPAPALQGQPMTPAVVGTAAPVTPAPKRDEVQESPKNAQMKRALEEQGDEHEAKKMDKTSSPRRTQDKRTLTEEETEEP